MRASLLLMAGMLVLAPAVDAADKATLQADIDSTVTAMHIAKSAGDYVTATQLEAEYQDLLAELREVSFVGMATNPVGPPVAPAAPAGSTATTSNHSSAAVVATVDLATVTDTIAVASGDSYISDVDVTVNITHTWCSDLEVTLTSPLGTVVELTLGNGGSNDDCFNGTLFDSSAAGVPTLEAYADSVTAGPMTATGDLGAFIGEDPNGIWTLSIGDTANADGGASNGWSMDITTLDGAPTEATTNHASANVVNTIDLATVGDDLVVGGLGTYMCDVNLTTNITHTWSSDLQVVLVSPGGTASAITFNNGGSNDDCFNGTLFDASAGSTPTTEIYADSVTAGPMTAEGTLSGFIGEDPNGTWTLLIGDTANADGGASNGWSLDITTCIGEAPECFLVVGNAPVDGPFQYQPFWGHDFTTQVGDVGQWYPVLMEDIPSFQLPSAKRRAPKFVAPTTLGSLDDSVGQGSTVPTPATFDEYYVQVLMWNPAVFPSLPEQYSNGLAVRIFSDGRVLTVPYGDSTGGMTVWSEIFTDNGKRYIQFPFDVPLM